MTLTLVQQPVRSRAERFEDAFHHWLACGFSSDTAILLAGAKHFENEELHRFALLYILTNTNMREEDLL